MSTSLIVLANAKTVECARTEHVHAEKDGEEISA